MKNIFKLLSVILVLSVSTQSFGMWSYFVDRAKFASIKSYRILRHDLQTPRQIVLKAFGGAAVGSISFGASSDLIQPKPGQKHFPTWKDRLRKPSVNVLACAGAGAVAGPIGVAGWLTAVMLANRANEKNMTSARQDFASRFLVKLEPLSKPLPKMTDIGPRPPTIN
jgi:hypothetical protein